MSLDADLAAHEQLVAAARGGDRAAFDRLVAPHRRELLAHCYRMLGSVHDADDALQDTLVRAWRGLPGFAGRSSLRTWLYRIATNVCLTLAGRAERRRRTTGVAGPGDEPPWLEPFAIRHDDGIDGSDVIDTLAATGVDASPPAVIDRRESMELAFIVAFQHLPAGERAALLLRDVLSFSAAETAVVLDVTVTAVNSRLQRARRRLAGRVPAESQHHTLRTLGDERVRGLVTAYVDAWERGDADAIVALVTDDAVFSMPPRPEVFHGRGEIRRFLGEGALAHRWRVVPIGINGQPGFACYIDAGDRWTAHSVDVVAVRGHRLHHIVGFLDADLVVRLGLPRHLPASAR